MPGLCVGRGVVGVCGVSIIGCWEGGGVSVTTRYPTRTFTLISTYCYCSRDVSRCVMCRAGRDR